MQRWELALGGSVGIGAIALGTALFATQLTAPSDATLLSSYISAHAQRLDVAHDSVPAPVISPSPVAGPAAITSTSGAVPAASDLSRDGYGSTPGVRTLAGSGTNHDWARIVLLDGGWPQTDANITVLTRWMRQENGVDDWWNRDNPLNIGAGGFGTFPNLLAAAQATADLLHSNSGMTAIVAALAAGDDAARTESAIWYSNWAGGHYAYGAHWHYTPVDRVKAPAGAW